MAKTTFNLEYILNMANSIEFDTDEVYISRLLFEHYLDIPKYSLNKTLEILKISKTSFKKYLQQIGSQNYGQFKDEINFGKILRMKQIMDRYRLFDQDKVIHILQNLQSLNNINLECIDNICQAIYCSQRVIFYGSPTLLNLLYDFQIDIKIFNKTIFISSVNDGKIILPKKEDVIGICTATGRLFSCCDAQFQEKVLNTNNVKMLFTKDKIYRDDMDYIIAINTENDYYEMHYLFLFYFDLIKTRYYELYIKG